MYDRILIPYDRSSFSWRAVPYGRLLADHWQIPLTVVHITDEESLIAPARAEIEDRLDEHGWRGAVEHRVELVGPGGVGDAVARIAGETPRTLVVMTTHGRGRSAAFLGSIAEEILHQLGEPMVLIGPNARGERLSLDGPVVACVDGSETSESVLPLVADLAQDFGSEPWIVVVAGPEANPTLDTLAANYATRVARHLERDAASPVQFEVLHDEQPAMAAAKFASDIGASMLAAVTHGRTGLGRLLEGSTTMKLVHEADVPVLVSLAEEGK